MTLHLNSGHENAKCFFLEINWPIENFIVLSDNFGSGGGPIKYDSKPLASHSRGNASDYKEGIIGMNYDCLVTKDTDDRSFSPSHHMPDLKFVEAY